MTNGRVGEWKLKKIEGGERRGIWRVGEEGDMEGGREGAKHVPYRVEERKGEVRGEGEGK